MTRTTKQHQIIKPIQEPDPPYTVNNIGSVKHALQELNRLHWECETLRQYINSQPEME